MPRPIVEQDDETARTEMPAASYETEPEWELPFEPFSALGVGVIVVGGFALAGAYLWHKIRDPK